MLGIWSAIAHWRGNGILPDPVDVLRASFRLTLQGHIFLDAAVSSLRVLVGLGVCVAVGVSIAWFVRLRPSIAGFFRAPLSFLRYLPPTGFIPLLMLAFGIGESFRLSVLVAAVLFFVMQMALDAVDAIDPVYDRMARLAGLSDIEVLRFVVIPASLPRVAELVRVNLSAAWTFIVLAEGMVLSSDGLGSSLYLAVRFFRLPEAYAYLLTLGLIGVFSDTLLARLQRRWGRWQQDIDATHSYETINR